MALSEVSLNRGLRAARLHSPALSSGSTAAASRWNKGHPGRAVRIREMDRRGPPSAFPLHRVARRQGIDCPPEYIASGPGKIPWSPGPVAAHTTSGARLLEIGRVKPDSAPSCAVSAHKFSPQLHDLTLESGAMEKHQRRPGFWAEVGIVYDVERVDAVDVWRARLPGRCDIEGRGRNKSVALSHLKSAYGRAASRDHQASTPAPSPRALTSIRPASPAFHRQS